MLPPRGSCLWAPCTGPMDGECPPAPGHPAKEAEGRDSSLGKLTLTGLRATAWGAPIPGTGCPSTTGQPHPRARGCDPPSLEKHCGLGHLQRSALHTCCYRIDWNRHGGSDQGVTRHPHSGLAFLSRGGLQTPHWGTSLSAGFTGVSPFTHPASRSQECAAIRSPKESGDDLPC